MKLQSRYYLAWARKELANAKTMLDVELIDPVGRAAYMAGFHAAQALLFERVGKAFKTHGGVHSEFARSTRNEERLSDHLKTFLSRAYRLKTNADYVRDEGATVSLIVGTLAEANEFVDIVEVMLTNQAEA